MWSAWRLWPVFVYLTSVSVAGQAAFHIPRFPRVTHEEFCLGATATTKKPLPHPQDYYQDMPLPLSLEAWWTHPADLLTDWFLRAWEHLVYHQNPLRDEECRASSSYGWKYVAKGEESHDIARDQLRSLSKTFRRTGTAAVPSVHETRRVCDSLLKWAQGNVDNTVSVMIWCLGRLLFLLRFHVLDVLGALITRTFGLLVLGATAIAAGVFQSLFEIAHTGWILAIMFFQLQHQAVLSSLLAVWNVSKGASVAVGGFLLSLVRDCRHRAVRQLIQTEDTILTVLAGCINAAWNTLSNGGASMEKVITGGLAQTGQQSWRLISLMVNAGVRTKETMRSVGYSILGVIGGGQRAHLLAAVYFTKIIRRAQGYSQHTFSRAAHVLAPCLSLEGALAWGVLTAWIEHGLPWIITCVACAFACIMWHRAHRVGEATTAVGRIRREFVSASLQEEERQKESEGQRQDRDTSKVEESGFRESTASVSIQGAWPKLSHQRQAIQSPSSPDSPSDGRRMHAGHVRERKGEQEETEWGAWSRRRWTRGCGTVVFAQASVKPQGVKSTEWPAHEVRAPAARDKASQEKSKVSFLSTLRPSPSPSSPKSPGFLPAGIVLPFICGVWDMEHPDLAAVRVSMGEGAWEEFIARYRQDFADRGIGKERAGRHVNRLSDGRCSLSEDEIEYLLQPPFAGISIEDFVRFCECVERAPVALRSRGRAVMNAGKEEEEEEKEEKEEKEEGATIGGDEIGNGALLT